MLGIQVYNNRYSISLDPLEKLSNLENLTISGSSINNIKPLENLKNLKNLQLKNMKLYDLGPLKKLTQLQELFLIDCDTTYGEEEKLQKALPNLRITKRTTPSIRI